MHLLSATTVVAMLVSASAATAYTRFTSRSASYAVVADCPNRPVTNVCDPTATVPFGSFPDYPGVEDYQPTHEAIDTTAFARLFPVGGARSHGSATAYSVTTPGDLLPSLKAGAFTRPDELGRFTTSYAYVSTLFAYTYVGAEPVALPLVGTLDATISFAPINFGNPLGAGSFPYSFGQLRGQLAVLNESVFTGAPLDLASLTCGNAGVLSAGVGSTGRGGFASGGVTQNVSLGFDLSTGCDGNALTLTPGERFYLYAFVDVLAAHGGTTDATNSFNLGFAPGTPPAVVAALTQGVSLLTAVPEPRSWVLMLGGFGLVGGVARRRRVALASLEQCRR